MFLDSSSFWQGIIHIGLLDEFVKEIKGGVDSLKNDLIRNRSSADGENTFKWYKLIYISSCYCMYKWYKLIYISSCNYVSPEKIL